jgi:hypothetical protein
VIPMDRQAGCRTTRLERPAVVQQRSRKALPAGATASPAGRGAGAGFKVRSRRGALARTALFGGCRAPGGRLALLGAEQWTDQQSRWPSGSSGAATGMIPRSSAGRLPVLSARQRRYPERRQ